MSTLPKKILVANRVGHLLAPAKPLQPLVGGREADDDNTRFVARNRRRQHPAGRFDRRAADRLGRHAEPARLGQRLAKQARPTARLRQRGDRRAADWQGVVELRATSDG